MIVESILDMFQTVVLFLINGMPVLGFAQQQLGSFAGLVELFAYSSYFIPYSSLFVCLGIGISFYSAKFAMSIINWIIGKIPTVD